MSVEDIHRKFRAAMEPTANLVSKPEKMLGLSIFRQIEVIARQPMRFEVTSREHLSEMFENERVKIMGKIDFSGIPVLVNPSVPPGVVAVREGARITKVIPLYDWAKEDAERFSKAIEGILPR
jgi:hypothetical protein